MDELTGSVERITYYNRRHRHGRAQQPGAKRFTALEWRLGKS
jgi:hypothetical protein